MLNIAVAHCCVIHDVYAYRFTLDEQHFAQQLVHAGAESCELVLNCGALERDWREERMGVSRLRRESGSSRLITGFSSSTSAASFSNLSLKKVDQLTVQRSE